MPESRAIFSESDWRDYVGGGKFSNGANFTLTGSTDQSLDRLDVLVDLCRGKRVIHFGFADHAPLIPQKMQHGRWLHKRLLDVASACIGLDSHRETVEFVTRDLGIDGCYTFDLMTDAFSNLNAGDKWDVLVIGEVLEHIDNPVLFLKKIVDNFRDDVSELVITVPNAFFLLNFLKALKGREYINTDHRFWFSPYTLTKVAHDAGLECQKLQLCGWLAGYGFLHRMLANRFPLFRETIIGTFRVSAN